MAQTGKALARVEGLGRSAAPGILSTLMALTSDAVLTFDGFGRILAANAQAESLTGLTAEELRDSDVRDLIFDASQVGSDGTLDARVPHDVPGANPDGATAAVDTLIHRPLPFPPDGSLQERSLRLATGGAALVGLRCDRASAPGETYLLVMRPQDASQAAEREHDRLVEELSQANRRLSGTLRIVLETIDVQDVDVLFSEVLEQISDTLEASGTLLYLAESDGFRLRGCTRSLARRKVPQFMAYGEGIETVATRAGVALRLRLKPPSEESLRSGTLRHREIVDEETGVVRRIPARQVPPFAGFICVPVWFGGHVIAILEVGWADARPLRRDDARLLDSVSQYLSVELAAAISSLRAERTQRLDAAAQSLRETIEETPELIEGDLSQAAAALCDTLGVRIAPVTKGALKDSCVVRRPGGAGEVTLDRSLDSLVEGHVDGDVAVVPIPLGSDLDRELAAVGLAGPAVLLDLGVLAGERRAAFILREPGAEPLAAEELDFLERVAVDVREAVEAGEHRSKDARISQALQSGMKNVLQKVEGITAHGLYSSATASASVGGDFYDLVRLPNRRACVILGDVSGKGVEAASVSAAVKTALGAYAWEGLPPARMVRLLNDFLLGFSRLETFATMFVGIIDLRHATLSYCSAGHPPALFLRSKAGDMVTLDIQSGVVGAFSGMAYQDGHVGLVEGDRLFLYTDGVTEARSPEGAFFGEQGLRDAVMEEASRGSFDDLLVRMLARLDAFTERKLDDDVAMVALRFDALGQTPKA